MGNSDWKKQRNEWKRQQARAARLRTREVSISDGTAAKINAAAKRMGVEQTKDRNARNRIKKNAPLPEKYAAHVRILKAQDAIRQSHLREMERYTRIGNESRVKEYGGHARKMSDALLDTLRKMQELSSKSSRKSTAAKPKTALPRKKPGRKRGR